MSAHKTSTHPYSLWLYTQAVTMSALKCQPINTTLFRCLVGDGKLPATEAAEIVRAAYCGNEILQRILVCGFNAIQVELMHNYNLWLGDNAAMFNINKTLANESATG